MSVAVLKEPIIDAAALEREIIDIIGLISAKNLPRIKALAEEIGIEEAAEYVPHSFDELPEETRLAIEDAENGIGLGEPVSVEEFKEWVREVAAEARAEKACNG